MEGFTKAEWRSKDINECILDGIDPECLFQPGVEADLSIVNKYLIREIYILLINLFAALFLWPKSRVHDCWVERSSGKSKAKHFNVVSCCWIAGRSQNNSHRFGKEFANLFQGCLQAILSRPEW